MSHTSVIVPRIQPPVTAHASFLDSSSRSASGATAKVQHSMSGCTQAVLWTAHLRAMPLLQRNVHSQRVQGGGDAQAMPSQ